MPRYKPTLSELGWLSNIPELITRPILMESLRSDGKLRRRFFQVTAHLESIALIPDRYIASHCLTLYWKETKQSLYKYWHNKLRERTSSDVLFNEFYGCLYNVRKNMIRKCGFNFNNYTRYDIKREYKHVR